MNDLAIAVRIGSPLSNINFVKNTFDSFLNNLKNCDFKTFISIGDVNSSLIKLIYDYCLKYPNRFYVFEHDKTTSWAQSINKAIEISGEYKYFAKSHDDIILKTDNFWEKFNFQITNLKKNVGWISFTDIGFKIGNYNPSTRPGHHIDVMENFGLTGQIFQFNKFPPNWYRASFIEHLLYSKTNGILRRFGSNTLLNYPKPIKKINNYKLDMPVKPVYCHAPFNHFVIIDRNVLKIIGKCEDLGTSNSLLADEDWGLTARLHGFPNIWLPDLEYIHERPTTVAGGGTRSIEQIKKFKSIAHEKFKKKWGFDSKPSIKDISFIEKEYKNTQVVWSLERRSFDWDYI